MKSLSRNLLILIVLGLGMNSYAATINVSCDSEEDESIAGQTYYEVEGKLNLKNATSENLNLKYKEVVETGSNKVLAVVPAKKIKYKEKGDNKSVYSFSGEIKGEEHNVEIIFTMNAIRGLSYAIKVNDIKLRWCNPISGN